MPAEKREKLDAAIAAIQKRWGTQAIQRFAQRLDKQVPHIASGFTDLDLALGVGGIPRGRISELVGAPTCGATTLAYKFLAQAQAAHGMAIYLDLDRVFDPAYAQRCGVSLAQVIVVHPYNPAQAVEMLPDFVHNGGFDLLICDLPLRLQEDTRIGSRLASALGRLLAPLSKSNMTLLFITTLPAGSQSTHENAAQTVLPFFSSVRLYLQLDRWLYRQHDVCGFEAQVAVIKNKLAVPGKKARIVFEIVECAGDGG